MSSRDPDLYPRSSLSHMNRHRFNPTANNFAPSSHGSMNQQKNGNHQVSTPPSPYLEARVLNLEEEHAILLDDVSTLKELYHDLSFSVDKLKRGGWPVHVGPFQDVDPAKSHQSAMQFKLELEELTREVHLSVDGGADTKKVNSTGASRVNTSIPPHAKVRSLTSNGTVSESLPPHVRSVRKTENNATKE